MLDFFYLLYFVQVAHWMGNICARKFHAHCLRKICKSLDFLLLMRKILSQMHNICERLHFSPQCAIYAHDLRKIVLLSPMHNICARFTSFLNVQYMGKIRTRLCFFPRCAIYAQNLCKIVLLSPMHNLCARFEQDCASLPNASQSEGIDVLCLKW